MSWQILRMDKCVFVVHLFYKHDLMPHMFLLLHTRVTFKLFVICTILER